MLSAHVQAVDSRLDDLVKHLGVDNEIPKHRSSVAGNIVQCDSAYASHVALPPIKEESENSVDVTLDIISERSVPPKWEAKSPLKRNDTSGNSREMVSPNKDWDDENSETLPLEGNLWDAALLVGLRCSDHRKWFVARANCIVIILLLFLNGFMQGLFLIAISFVHGHPYDDDTIEALRYQRLFVGHDLANVNRVDLQTRTANLCSQHVHNRLAGTWEDIFFYLEAGGVRFLPAGVVICLLAMLIWVLSMTTEIRRAIDVYLAILMLPKMEANSPSIFVRNEGSILMGMTRWRKAMLSMLVFLPRFAIAFLLMYYGMQYLAETASVMDLILNACALEIIKNIDELLFEAILSRRFHQGVQSIEIHVSHFKSTVELMFAPETTATIDGPTWVSKRQYIHAMMYVRLLFVAVLMIIGWVDHLEPVYTNTLMAKDMICSYDKNFVYAKHPEAILPIFASMDVEDNSTSQQQCFFASQYDLLAIRSGMEPKFADRNSTIELLVNGTHHLCKPPPNSKVSPLNCPEQDRVSKIMEISEMSSSDYLEGPLCRDQDVQMMVLRQTCLYSEFVEDFPPLERIFSKREMCSDFSESFTCSGSGCNERANQLGIPLAWLKIVHQICPKSCGYCKENKINSTLPQ